MVAGRGFIALAAQAMGGGECLGGMLSSLVFGFAQALGIKFSAVGLDSNLASPIPYAVTIIGLVIFSLVRRREEAALGCRAQIRRALCPNTKRSPSFSTATPAMTTPLRGSWRGPAGISGILAVTSCCGNQTIEKTTYNALRVCTLIGLHAPVGKGCPHPLLNDVMNAPSVHGESGA